MSALDARKPKPAFEQFDAPPPDLSRFWRPQPRSREYKSLAENLPGAATLFPRRALELSGMAVRFGTRDQRGEMFSEHADYGFRDRSTAILVPLAINHSLDSPDDLIGVARISYGPFGGGLMAEALFDREARHFGLFDRLWQPGAWGFSTGAEEAERASPGTITKWILAELSLTTNPADYSLRAVNRGRTIEGPLWNTEAERYAMAQRFRQGGFPALSDSA